MGLDASTQGYAPHAYGHLGHYYGKRSADPYYLGGYAGLAHGYAAHGVVAAAVPFGSSTGLDALTQGLDASTQGYAPYAYGHLGVGHLGVGHLGVGHLGVGHLGHYYGKRSADAYYAHGYGLGYGHHAGAYGVPFGSSTGLDALTQGLDASTQGYAPHA